MLTLNAKMSDPHAFLCGVELVSTRGTLAEGRAVKAREIAKALSACNGVDWISITDNAGGNPMLSPTALGKWILYAGKDVIIHLSCKDFNRNGLESQAWQLASEGFHNILALSGDYPTKAFGGGAKPVFDIDSVGLLTMLSAMNQGMAHEQASKKNGKRLAPTNFFAGCVTTNFKRHENEVIPQYLKLERKLAAGARFVINQIGFDARKISELIGYVRRRGLEQTPLIGNVFLLNKRVAKVFHEDRIPGVVVSDVLFKECERQAASPDKGRVYFLDFAAKQVAIYKGLGYRGAYLGGIEAPEEVHEIMERNAAFAADDWKTFAKEIRYSQPSEFFLFAENEDTGLADPQRLDPAFQASLATRPSSPHGAFNYLMSRWVHDTFFAPGSRWYKRLQGVYQRAANAAQGPRLFRLLEDASKSLIFQCKDCGDCSLPDTAFLCPESQCAKNQRNGPCGGTLDGQCEAADLACIWSRAYDRLKWAGQSEKMLQGPPVLQNQALRGTSSWANTFLGRDHHHHPTSDENGESNPKETEKTHACPCDAPPRPRTAGSETL